MNLLNKNENVGRKTIIILKKHSSFQSVKWVDFRYLRFYKIFVAKYSGKVGLPYGEKESDFNLQNKLTSEALEAPMVVYVGDGSDGGFKSVYVSLCAYYFGKLNLHYCFQSVN